MLAIRKRSRLLSASGCVDWAAFSFPVIPGRDDGSEHSDEVDLRLEVSSDAWSGTVHFNGPKQPPCGGLRGIPCEAGEVCIHESGTCSVADDFGICVERCFSAKAWYVVG